MQIKIHAYISTTGFGSWSKTVLVVRRLRTLQSQENKSSSNLKNQQTFAENVRTHRMWLLANVSAKLITQMSARMTFTMIMNITGWYDLDSLVTFTLVYGVKSSMLPSLQPSARLGVKVNWPCLHGSKIFMFDSATTPEYYALLKSKQTTFVPLLSFTLNCWLFRPWKK